MAQGVLQGGEVARCVIGEPGNEASGVGAGQDPVQIIKGVLCGIPPGIGLGEEPPAS